MKPAFLPSAPGPTMSYYRSQEVLAPGAGWPVAPQYPPKVGPANWFRSMRTLPMEPGPGASEGRGPEEQGSPSLWTDITPLRPESSNSGLGEGDSKRRRVSPYPSSGRAASRPGLCATAPGRRAGPFRSLSGLQEIRVDTQEESGVLCFPSQASSPFRTPTTGSLQSCALYSIRPCFYHQSHPQLGILFALSPSLHSFWSYFSTDAMLSRFSRVRLCATPQVAAHQAPPSLGSSRQEYWSGLPFPSPMQESEK